MKQKHYLVVPLLIAATSFTASKTNVFAQNQVILPQGAFEQATGDGKPAGWTVQSPQGTALAGDAKNRWVQLRDGAVITHFLKLAPEWTKVTISARVKMSNFQKGPEGWHGARIGLRFDDDKNQMVGQYPPAIDVNADTD
jgi:hypothetical protein